MSGRVFPSFRQALWVAAGVVLLTLLVIAASWLFSPRPSGTAPRASGFTVSESRVEKSTFQPEPPGDASRERFHPEGSARPVAPPAKTETVPPPQPKPAQEPVPPPAPESYSPPPPPHSKPEKTAAPPLPASPPPPVKEPSRTQPIAAPKPEPPASPPPSAPPAPAPSRTAARGAYGVQVGAFSSPDNARSIARNLEAHGYRVALVTAGKATKVVVSGCSDRPAAEKVQADLRAKGYDGAFVVPLE